MVRPDDVKEKYIFFSYSHKGEKQAVKIISALQSAGYYVWFDQDLVPGKQYDKAIEKRIEGCAAFVCFLTPMFCQSDYCFDETRYAVQECRKFTLPIYIGDEVNREFIPEGLRKNITPLHSLCLGANEDAETLIREISKIHELDACNWKKDERKRIAHIYKEANTLIAKAKTENEYKEAAELFAKIRDKHENARQKEQDCLAKAEECRKNDIYAKACLEKEKKTIAGYEKAIDLFNKIAGYKNVDEQIIDSYNKIEEIKAKTYDSALTKMTWASSGKDYEQAAEGFEKYTEYKDARLLGKANRNVAKNLFHQTVIIGIVSAILILSIGFSTYYIHALVQNLDQAEKQAEEDQKKINAQAQESENYQEYIKKAIQTMSWQVGDHVQFGLYEQDGNEANGKEVIKWRVLEIQDDKMLVISEYGLEIKRYNEEFVDITWENCSLRNWLNHDFMNEAFGTSLQSMIIESEVRTEKNPEYDTDPGYDTRDRVFLLSIQEVVEYFRDEKERECMATAHALEGIRKYYKERNWTDFEEDYGSDHRCQWWLRSPGNNPRLAPLVNWDGSVWPVNVDNGTWVVRPALWISLKS